MAVVNSDLKVSLISIFLIRPPVNSNLVLSILHNSNFTRV